MSNPWQLYEAYYSSALNKNPELKDKKLTVFKPVPGADKNLVLNCLKFVKRLKLPGLCKVVDVIDDRAESSLDSVLIVTEFVRPVSSALDEDRIGYNGLLLGVFDLFQLMNVVDSKFVLGTICPQNLYFNELGEWCFFGLDCCVEREQLKTSAFGTEFESNLKTWCTQSGVHLNERELTNGDYMTLDRISLGLLIKDLLNTMLPRDWEMPINSLANNGRVSVERVFKQIKSSSTFKNSVLLSLYEESKELKITTPKDRIRLVKSLAKYFLLDDDNNNNLNVINELTPGIIRNLIVTELCCPSLEYMLQESVSNMQLYHSDIVLSLTLMLTLLTADRHCLDIPVGNVVSELMFKLFKVSDRQIRFTLLLFLPKIFDPEVGPKGIFPNNSFRDRIFPFFLQGFIDTDRSIRMMTLKSIPKVVDHLSDRQLNNEVLRSIAKTQVDGDKDIRTETILVVIKIAGKLNKLNNRDNVLATIFTKSLKDPNIKTKLGALYGLKECLDLFSPEVIANKIMSVIAPGLLDKDKVIRVKAKELFDIYVKRLETEATTKYGDDSTESGTDVLVEEDYVEGEFSKSAEIEMQELEVMIQEFARSLQITEDVPEATEMVTGPDMVAAASVPADSLGPSSREEIVADDDDDADWGAFDSFDSDVREPETKTKTVSTETSRGIYTARRAATVPFSGTKRAGILSGAKKSSILASGSNTEKHTKRLSILSKNIQKHDTSNILSKTRNVSDSTRGGTSTLERQKPLGNAANSSKKTQKELEESPGADDGDDDFDAWDEEW